MCFTSLQFLMSPTCQLSFKFANKVSITRKTSWKIPMHYVNATFDFLGTSFLEKGKYLVTELSFLCRVINMKFYWFIADFLFLFERYKIKEIGCSFEVPLFSYCFKFKLFFASCKDSYPLDKPSKRRNYLKPENLETLFLLSALKKCLLCH